jgi:hypothetical protein
MQGFPHSIPAWNESDSFRETTLHLFSDPKDREALRHVGGILYDLALEADRGLAGESSIREEMRAVAADLRYVEGYLVMIGRLSEESSLSPTDDALARFAGKLAGQVGAVAAAIEEEL